MFYIEDGREHFYQWDINRRLIIEDSTITEVHFCNKTEDCSLVVEVYEENGKHLANVPNILLQNAWNIKVYAFDTEYTKHFKVFKVISRSKPADYIYTETELKDYAEYEDRLVELEVKEANRDWQLIETVTIEQEVQRIYCDLKGGKYKELHLHMIMPTRNPNKESNYPKGRSNVYIQGNKTVYDDGSYWYVDDGNPYCVYTYDVSLIGNICKVRRLRYPTTRPEYPYLTGYVQDRSGYTTGIHIDDDYISELSVSLLPTGSFAFSVGTTYELWGVRA